MLSPVTTMIARRPHYISFWMVVECSIGLSSAYHTNNKVAALQPTSNSLRIIQFEQRKKNTFRVRI